MSPRPSGYQWLLDVAISRSAYRCLHCFGRGNELIERLAPPVAEAHAIVRIAILLVLMHGKRGVFRSLCMASAVYFVPFPCGAIMMIAVKAGTSKVGLDGR